MNILKNVFPLIITLVLVGAGCAAPSTTNNTNGSLDDENSGLSVGETATVEHTAEGFSPRAVVVKKGGTVTFVNKSEDEFWPAANPHPSHTGYPTKGGCADSLFDACKKLETGKTYSFTFNETGTWKYHDHLNPVHAGTVIVK